MKKVLIIYFLVSLTFPDLFVCAQIDSVSRPFIYYAQGVTGSVKYLSVLREPEDALVAITDDRVVFMRLGDLKEINNYNHGRFGAKDFDVSDNYLASTFKYRGKQGIAIQELASGKQVDTLFFIFNKPKDFVLSKSGDHLIIFKKDVYKNPVIEVYTTLKLQLQPLIISLKKGGVQQVFEISQNNKNYYVINRFENFGKHEISIIDDSGETKYKVTGKISGITMLNDERIAFIENENSIRTLDYSKSVEEPLLSKGAVFDFNMDNNASITSDGKYFISKKLRSSFDEYDVQLQSLPDSVNDNSPLLHEVWKMRDPINKFTYVFDIAKQTIVDSFSFGGSKYCYDSKNQRLIYFNTIDKNYAKSFFAYELLAKNTTSFKTDNTLGYFRDITFNKLKNTFATLASNGDINIINIQSETKSKLIYQQDSSDGIKVSGNKLFYTESGMFLLKTSPYKIVYWNSDSFAVNHTVNIRDSIINVYQTKNDSIIYFLTYSSLFKLNFITNITTLLFDRRKFLKNQDDISEPLDLIDDTTAVGISTQPYDYDSKKIISWANIRNSKNDHYIFRYSLNIISLKTGAIIYSYCDSTKYNFPGKKTSDDSNFSMPPYYFSDIIGVNADTSNHIVKTFCYMYWSSFIIDYKTGKAKLIKGFDSSNYIDYFNDNLLSFSNSFKKTLNYDSLLAFELTEDGLLKLINRKNFQEQLQIVYYLPNQGSIYDNDWLFFSKKGYFDGNSNVVDLFFWKDTTINQYYSYDAFYNSFYTPHLFYNILKHKTVEKSLDIGYYTKIPGLTEMIKDGSASVIQNNNNHYLCISKVSENNSVFKLESTSNIILSQGADSCKIKILLPSSLNIDGLVKNNRPADTESLYKQHSSKGILYVTFIGVGDYPKNSNLDTLPFTKRSIENVRNSLLKNYSYLKNSFDSIVLYDLIDSNATLTKIKNHLNYLILHVHEDDCVLFYFNGHGIVPTGSEVFYFFPFNGINGTIYDIQNTCLSTPTFVDMFSFFNCGRIILIIDACQSGGSMESLEKILEVKNTSSDGNNSLNIITATLSIENASQMKEGSILSQEISEAANQMILPKNSTITINSFIGLIKKIASNLNKFEVTQTPVFLHKGTDFPLFKN